MGLYIKGMDMPTGDKAFHLEIHKDGTVLMWQMMDSDKAVGKAIPVPEHGRLIDADALEQEAQKRLLICNKYDNQFQKPYEVVRAIALAPTIIPASEEE